MALYTISTKIPSFVVEADSEEEALTKRGNLWAEKTVEELGKIEATLKESAKLGEVEKSKDVEAYVRKNHPIIGDPNMSCLVVNERTGETKRDKRGNDIRITVRESYEQDIRELTRLRRFLLKNIKNPEPPVKQMEEIDRLNADPWFYKNTGWTRLMVNDYFLETHPNESPWMKRTSSLVQRLERWLGEPVLGLTMESIEEEAEDE